MNSQLEIKIKSLEKEVKDEREKLSSDRMDISFGELINLYKNEELIIRPEYQRLFRWTNNQKTALIESILLGIPIPPIFVAEDEDGVWELVDGLQRISTIISFFGDLKGNITGIEESDDENNKGEDDDENESESNQVNNWVLGQGSIIKELEGFDVNDFPKKYQINIKRAVCRVEILRGQSNVAMKYELFKRLNSGGAKLTEQEIRNAIYRGIDSKINDLIVELSKEEKFKKLVSVSNQKKKELYDQELVLRFIAFMNKIEDINSNTGNYLDRFMEKAVHDKVFDVEYYRNIFKEVLGIIDSINDLAVFKTVKNTFVPGYYEGIMIGVAQNITTYRNDKELLEIKVKELKSDEKFKKYSGSASNSKNRVKNRLKRANEIFANTER